MTRTLISFMALLLIAPTSVFATADSPVVQGLGGAGRAGVPGEGLFLNPASIASLQESGGFLYFEKPTIPDWNAGGRAYSLGVYDGQNPTAKGAFGYTRTSRARIDLSGIQGYEDRSDFRFAVAAKLWSNVAGGLTARYVTRRIGTEEEKFFNGDLGTTFPIYSDLIGGITFENVLHQAGELPPTLGAGVSYILGMGLQAYGDGYRLMKGTKKGERGWGLGLEASLSSGFKLRAGRFQEAYRRIKGWSAGLSWIGPRTSFDYTMKTSGNGPKERDHIFGISVNL